MGFYLVFSVFGVILTTVCGNHDIYAGHTVHGVHLRNEEDQRILYELQHKLNLDIWRYGWPGVRPSLVMLSPDQTKTVLDALDNYGIEHYLDVADVKKQLEEFDEDLERYRRSRSGRLVPFEDFPRHAEVDAYLERVAAENPDIVTLVNAGNSWEGRSIKYLRISTTNFTDTSKPIYFMVAMLHAREWVTTPVTLYSIHRLVEDLREGDRDLLEGVDWIILPLANPDGYEFSHVGDRMWRRTRSNRTEISTTCLGVDANRNFDVNHLQIPGASTNPCSQDFAGPYAFSEPETTIVGQILRDNVDRLQVHMDIHSHGNYVLYGFGNRTLPSNAAQLHHVAALMGSVMDSVKLNEAGFYTIGNSAWILYFSSGSCQDYGQFVGVPFAYTLELPGYGRGFQVPPEYIEHINEETWLGIAASARAAKVFYENRIRG